MPHEQIPKTNTINSSGEVNCHKHDLSGSSVDGSSYGVDDNIRNMASTHFLGNPADVEEGAMSTSECVEEIGSTQSACAELLNNSRDINKICPVVEESIRAVHSEIRRADPNDVSILYRDENQTNTKGFCYRMVIADSGEFENSKNGNNSMAEVDHDKDKYDSTSPSPSLPSQNTNVRSGVIDVLSTDNDTSHKHTNMAEHVRHIAIENNNSDSADNDDNGLLCRDQTSPFVVSSGENQLQSNASSSSNIVVISDRENNTVGKTDTESADTCAGACLLATSAVPCQTEKRSLLTSPEGSDPYSETAESHSNDTPCQDYGMGCSLLSPHGDNEENKPIASPTQEQLTESNPSSIQPPSPPIPSPQPTEIDQFPTTPIKPRSSSPHHRMRFSATGDSMPQTQDRNPKPSLSTTDMEVKTNQISSLNPVSIPLNPTQQKSKTSMSCGGCFPIGHLGRKKKRKLSPRGNRDANTDFNQMKDDKENLEDSVFENVKTETKTQEDVDSKMSKVCDEDSILDTLKNANPQLEPNNIMFPDIEAVVNNADKTNNIITYLPSQDDNNNKDSDNTGNFDNTDQNNTGHIDEDNARIDDNKNHSKQEPEGVDNSEEIDTVAATLWDDPFKFSRSRIQPGSFRFRRAFSQKTRMKPLLENVVSGSGDKEVKVDDDDDDDIGDLNPVQFTAAADGVSHIGSRRMGGTFHRRAFSLKRHIHSSASSSPISSPTYGLQKSHLKDSQPKYGDNKHPRPNQQLQRSQSLKTQIMSFFVNLHGNAKASSPLSRTGSVNKHSLASVELSSWASRGSTRRSGTLTPFNSSLNPLGVSTRAEILQTISSAIIHLFQRKRLKENELGLLQEHVRFLIEAEAGVLLYDYYKDQLLRKGMVILREKIKNEQGLELLTMLGETWDYFFREILPNLQAILYPLNPVLANDESIRSLSLLAFRNIVVLKVGIREALDSVKKHSYPPSVQQMLLVLQGITDNVFLSENQFLLEKLVARVVCPYMGQRGIYEGGPEPVVKVKLKPLPLNIPLESTSDPLDRTVSSFTSDSFIATNNKPTPFSPQSSSSKKLSTAQTTNGDGGTKLKTVLEHLQDNGRRHSVVS